MCCLLIRTDNDREPSLWELMNDVSAKVVPRKWKDLALYLELTTIDVDRIDYQNHGSVHDCFREVFSLWRSRVTPPYRWATMIAALKTPCVDENRVAIELEKKYRTVSDQSPGSILGKHSRGDSDVPTELPQKQQRQT